jgi:hypothetical protein
MQIESSYICAYCFQLNEIVLDASGGEEQEYIEDCEVCCRPNSLSITIDVISRTAEIRADVC